MPLVEFAYNNSYKASIGMAPYKNLYGRKCKSPFHWDEVGEKAIVGPELVQKTVKRIQVIQQQMKAAQDRYKSYVDKRQRPLKFKVSDSVFLKVLPTKGVIWLRVKGKLDPR